MDQPSKDTVTRIPNKETTEQEQLFFAVPAVVHAAVLKVIGGLSIEEHYPIWNALQQCQQVKGKIISD